MILIGLYLTAIVAANLLVAKFGVTVVILNAFVFIALDLTTRDVLHEQWHGRNLWAKMAALIATGSALMCRMVSSGVMVVSTPIIQLSIPALLPTDTIRS